MAVVLALVAGTAPGEETLLEDSWQTMHIAGQRVGYLHSTAVREDNADGRIHTTEAAHIELRRMGITIAADVTVEQWEKPDGALIGYSVATKASSFTMINSGRVEGDQLVITERLGDGVRTRRIPWDPAAVGPMAQERLLRQNLVSGRQITTTAFIPDIAALSRVFITVGDVEPVELLNGTRDLRRVTIVVAAMPNVITTGWVDEEGETLKSHVPLMGGVDTYRATREEALRDLTASAEIMEQFFIAARTRFAEPEAVTEVLYRLHLPPEAGTWLPPEDPRQTIVKRAGNTVWLRVRTVPPPAQPRALDAPVSGVDAKSLQASSYIQSDDAEIVALAKQVVAGAKDQWDAARRLERWVAENMVNKDLTVAFASAKEALQTREGDCTEHAVLLAALCRAVGIPARIAVGIAYWHNVYGYHMWTEVQVGEWLAVDAALYAPFVSATRIKLLEATLETGAIDRSFYDLAPLIGRLKLDVLEYRTKNSDAMVRTGIDSDAAMDTDARRGHGGLDTYAGTVLDTKATN